MAIGNSVKANGSLSLERIPSATELPVAMTILWSFKRDPNAAVTGGLCGWQTEFSPAGYLFESDSGPSSLYVSINASTVYNNIAGTGWFWFAIVRSGSGVVGSGNNTSTAYVMADGGTSWTTVGTVVGDPFGWGVVNLKIFNSLTQCVESKANKHAIWTTNLTMAELLAETKKSAVQRTFDLYGYYPLNNHTTAGDDVKVAGPVARNYTRTGTGTTVVGDSPAFYGDDFQMLSSSPSDNTTDVDINTSIVLNFNMLVFPGSGNIRIYDGYDLIQTIGINSATFYNYSVTIDINTLENDTEYSVEVDSTAIKNIFNEYWPGLDGYGTDGYGDLNFTTIVIPPATEIYPVLFQPVNNQNNVIGDVLTINFNTDVLPSSGYIKIYDDTDILVHQVDVDLLTFEDTLVSIDVSDVELLLGHTYYVLIDSGAIETSNDIPWEGISNPEDWVFTIKSSTFQKNVILL